MFGVDYAAVTPSAGRVKAEGAGFVCRYLSTAGNPKNLTKEEAVRLRGAGLHIATVFETTANRALGGFAAGRYDAFSANGQGAACGMPAGSPIYFAVDFDATPAQQTQINEYFRGVATVIGLHRTAAYGGYYVIKRLFDAKLITYGWQTLAWSGGQWDPRAHIRQYSNGQKFAGLNVDFNRAMADDFGQWRTPTAQPAPAPGPSTSFPQTPWTDPGVTETPGFWKGFMQAVRQALGK